MNSASNSPEAILSVRDLRTCFDGEDSTVRAVDGVSFDLFPGEVLGVVGESGCGKSVTSLSIMGLLPAPKARIESGSILFQGTELTQLSSPARRRLCGRRMAMVFQDPMSSLNPYLKVEEQLVEGLQLHLELELQAARAKALQLLERVQIPDARQRLLDYPHQLSGGMRQRVMLAMALACDPEFVIFDEPTTALDVTVQAQILELISELRQQSQLAAMFITHDLAVVSELCDRVMVMYAGRIVEQAPTAQLFSAPTHPYTQALLRSLPKLDQKGPLSSIAGFPPRLDQGAFERCTFFPRCPAKTTACEREEPELTPLRTGHATGRSERNTAKRRCWRDPTELQP